MGWVPPCAAAARCLRLPWFALTLAVFGVSRVQCSLGDNVQAGRSVLKVKVGGKSCVIASLIGDKMEHCVMELMFEEGEIEFSVTGKNEMHLAGNMMDSDDEVCSIDAAAIEAANADIFGGAGSIRGA